MKTPGSPVKAVTYGILVDVGGSIAAGLVLVVLYAVFASPAEAWFSIAGFVAGCSASFLGGYVCARIAAAAEMKWVGVVAATSGLVSLLMGMGAYAFEWNALLALVGMAAVFAGGWTGAQRNRSARA